MGDSSRVVAAKRDSRVAAAAATTVFPLEMAGICFGGDGWRSMADVSLMIRSGGIAAAEVSLTCCHDNWKISWRLSTCLCPTIWWMWLY